MKIVVVGLRGFPNIQGGIETHCEELYPRIAAMGHEVIVVRRCGFVKENPPLSSYRGVQFKDIDSPFIIGLEAAVHTFKGIWYAKKAHADIVHIHAIGPAITIPFAKLLGLNIVMTVISETLKKKYNRTQRVHLIYNGITTLPISNTTHTDYLKSLGLQSGKYILAVGRFVEEKRFDKLIEAYIKLKRPDMQLVIVGNADYETDYCCSLKDFAIENQVILPGIIKGQHLSDLYANAALFVLPSSHEGLPKENYFKLNDMKDLVNQINGLLDNGKIKQTYDLSKYNWDHIAKQVEEVYQKAL